MIQSDKAISFTTCLTNNETVEHQDEGIGKDATDEEREVHVVLISDTE